MLLQALWKTLAAAFNFPPEEPPRNKCHWDFVLQEGGWLAHDVMQVGTLAALCAHLLAWRVLAQHPPPGPGAPACMPACMPAQSHDACARARTAGAAVEGGGRVPHGPRGRVL